MKPVDDYQTYDACRKQMVGLFTVLQQLVYKIHVIRTYSILSMISSRTIDNTQTSKLQQRSDPT